MNELLICLTLFSILLTAIWAGTGERSKYHRVLSWGVYLCLVLLALGVVERMIYLFTAF